MVAVVGDDAAPVGAGGGGPMPRKLKAASDSTA